MYRSIKVIVPLFLLFTIFWMSSCNKESADSNKGTLLVSVNDNLSDEPPVPDISITIVPGDMIKQTDLNGKCSFELAPGEYFVNAEVCCAGPGYISYHELVTITSNQTTEIALMACSACL